MDGCYIKNPINYEHKFKRDINIGYNMTTYEIPWQAEVWRKVLLTGRLRAD